MSTRRLLLVLILAAAAAVRCADLGGESLWLDEGVSYFKAAAPPGRIISGSSVDPNPPLYYLMLRGWMGIAGGGEAALRLLSAGFGILSVVLIYRLGASFGGPAPALLAAALGSVSPLLVHFSREARMYSLEIFLGLLSMLAFLEVVRGRRGWCLAGYVASTTLLLYTHTFSFSLLLAQNAAVAFMAIFRGRDFSVPGKRWLILQGICWALYLPWLLVIIRQAGELSRGGYWTPPLAAEDIGRMLRQFAGSVPLMTALGIMALTGFLPVRPGTSHPGTRPILAAWIALPILFPIAVSLCVVPVFVTRLTLPALPAVLLAAALGWNRLAGRFPRYLVAVGLLGLQAAALTTYFSRPTRQPLREAVVLLKAIGVPGDIVSVKPAWYRRLIGEYYGGWGGGMAVGGEALIEIPGNPAAKKGGTRYSLFCEAFPGEDRYPNARGGAGACVRFPYFNYQADRWMEVRIQRADPETTVSPKEGRGAR
ncbi:MAG TPA: glycosyltransferase family 39 protein [bacterium]|nr:glycosyltransferase family 39 protein [bacterium]HPQ65401.1 glycosyltransferase family 39 protein [bacterium]